MRAVTTVGLIAVAAALAGPSRASSLTSIYQDEPGAGASNLGTPIPVAGGAVMGTSHAGGANGFGQVFLLTPGATAQSAWTKTSIHDFRGAADGVDPDNLMVDAAGNVWGVAGQGGTHGNGTVFELTRPTAAGGAWTYRLAVQLPVWLGGQATSKGYETLLDPSGDLYGLMHMGAYGTGCESAGCGLIFLVSAASLAGSGAPVRTLYTFSPAKWADGGFGGWPQGLTRDAHGNLYGVEYSGGNTFNPNTGNGPLGVVWEAIPPTAGGAWTAGVIYVFCEANYLSGDCADGVGPAGVTVDPRQGLLGTTEYSGGVNGDGNGVIFRLRNVNGAWKYTVLHTLVGTNPDGLHNGDFDVAKPLNQPTLSRGGSLVTTLGTGGAVNFGTASEALYVGRSGGVLAVNPGTGADANFSYGFGTQYLPGFGVSGPWVVNSPLREGPTGTFYGASQNYFSLKTNNNSLPGVIYRVTTP